MQCVNTFDVMIREDLGFHFSYQNGLYVYTVPIKSFEEADLISTVNENLQRYSKRKVKAAAHGESWISIYEDVHRHDRVGTISDIPATTQDVRRAEYIWGSDVNSLKGKTVQNKNPAVGNEYVERPVDKNITLFADITLVQEEPYLITAVKKALPKQLADCTSRGFVVRTLLTKAQCRILLYG